MKGMKAIIIVAFFVGVTTLVGTPTAGNPPGNPVAIRGGSPRFDQDSVERGHQMFVAQCGFCHGGNATGGQSGPDLIRSVLVMNDEAGKQLGEFLKVGRPDKGMPKFDLSEEQTKDIAAFLHQRIAAVVDRDSYKVLNILVGDAKAGEAYFNGAGKCNTCHSITEDLKGVGAKYDPVALQGRIVMPRGRGGFGGGPRRSAGGGRALSSFPTVTVTLPSGQSFSGLPLRVTDFDVVLRDDSGTIRSFTRDGDTPKVEVKDPLQAHVDMLAIWKDSDLHNMTAYLVTLK
ncbi:MAG TPA: c-type cytochrome [Blastocatellia bacterium]|jgi:mono/diheme cytochrome c family protein|nr:c-type cytochrome [Blastocatellia bacterium]